MLLMLSCPPIVDGHSLTSADLLVALKLAPSSESSPSVRELGAALGLSKSAVANAQRRLRDLGLLKEAKEGGSRVNKLALRDCLEHAVRWIAPATVGDFELGLPTAHTADVLSSKLTGDADPVVMPLLHGPMRGRAITPLHRLAPQAAARDPKLHRLLALVDVFRVGRARDRQVAAIELRACL